MERRTETHEEEGRPGRLRKVCRLVAVSFVFGCAAWAYWGWLRATQDVQLPPVTFPQPWVYEQQQSVDALLLWQEQLLKSPRDGAVQLTSGGVGAAVVAGEVVATLLSGGQTFNLKSPGRGFFLPWTDGMEGNWSYQNLWPGTAAFPEVPEPKQVENFSEVAAGSIVGKLLPLPQRPRALFYVQTTDFMSAALKKSKVTIRFEPNGSRWQADVRVVLPVSDLMAKVAVELPMFPLWMTRSRRLRLLICAGETSGYLVPESSVVMRQGHWGVYEVNGNRIVFIQVTGWPLGDGRFFISGGLQLGNPLVLDGASAEERRVEVW